MTDLIRTLQEWADNGDETFYATMQKAVYEATRYDIGYGGLGTSPDDFEEIDRTGRRHETHASIGIAAQAALLDYIGDDGSFAVNVLRDLLNNSVSVEELGEAFEIESTDDYREWYEAQ